MYQSCPHFLAVLLLFHHLAPPCNLKNLFHAIDVGAMIYRHPPKKFQHQQYAPRYSSNSLFFMFNPEFSLSLHGIAQNTNYMCLHPRICGIRLWGYWSTTTIGALLLWPLWALHFGHFCHYNWHHGCEVENITLNIKVAETPPLKGSSTKNFSIA